MSARGYTLHNVCPQLSFLFINSPERDPPVLGRIGCSGAHQGHADQGDGGSYRERSDKTQKQTDNSGSSDDYLEERGYDHGSLNLERNTEKRGFE